MTLALAFLLLDERLTAPQWGGAALILGAVAFQNAAALQRSRAGRVGVAVAPAAPRPADAGAARIRPPYEVIGIACVAAVLVLPARAGADEPAKGGAARLTLAQAEALVREMSATVEQFRRLRFKTPVAVEVVDGAAARKDFESEIDDADARRRGAPTTPGCTWASSPRRRTSCARTSTSRRTTSSATTRPAARSSAS